MILNAFVFIHYFLYIKGIKNGKTYKGKAVVKGRKNADCYMGHVKKRQSNV